MADSSNSLASHLGENIRHLREQRGLTQAQIAKLSDVPRTTWAHLESGVANPTLTVLHRVAAALQVPLEELLTRPRTAARHYPAATLASRTRGNVTVRQLLPEPIPGMAIERMQFPPGARLTGIPHTPGTREYLHCESGALELVAGGEQWRLSAGDVVAFRGDQKHSYANVGAGVAVGYSLIVLAPPLR